MPFVARNGDVGENPTPAISSKKIRIMYSVTYECEVDIIDGEDIEDTLQRIDIPQGGKHNSRLDPNFFKLSGI